jgi:lysine 2,3-aminomutase
VRNQSVLLKGVNNSFEELSNLIKTLSDINIQPVSTEIAPRHNTLPRYAHFIKEYSLNRIIANQHLQYYVYQCDMVQGVEDLRTPIQEIVDLDKRIRGTLSGFMMPSFVVDLPGGGGKRLVSTRENFDPVTGASTYTAPGLDGVKGRTLYTYYDPKPVKEAALIKLRQQKAQALRNGQTLEQVQSISLDPSHGPVISVPTNAIRRDAGRIYLNQSTQVSPLSTPVSMSAQTFDGNHVNKQANTKDNDFNTWSDDLEASHDGHENVRLAASG